MGGLSLEMVENSLKSTEYFINSSHDYETEDQQDWQQFAVSATLRAIEFMSAGGDVTVRQVLERIAQLRFEFALAQGHSNRRGENEFGKWRAASQYTIDEFSRLVRQKKTGVPGKVAGSVDFYTTVFARHQYFFNKLKDNMMRAVSGARDETRIRISDEVTKSVLLGEMDRRGIRISPEGYFDNAEFIKMSFLGEARNEQVILTSLYVVKNLDPVIIVMEHPHPRISAALMDTKLECLFTNCLNDACPAMTEKLGTAAELLWYCHQIMPFVRGSASIIQIFAAALLSKIGIAPVRYSGSRLDIDALSLPGSLFTEKFVGDYSGQA